VPAPATVSVTDTVRVEGLRVVRSGGEVLHGIDATVAPGSITGLLGPSGSGKTTLMRCLVGVQVVAAGRVEVLGLPAGSPSLRNRVGYVTQSPSVYADLTVTENLRYFAAVVGAPASDIERVLADVGLERHAHDVVNRLSGGEHARVSLATALLGAPELLVLDEPTVGLDPVLRRDLWQLFNELAGRGVALLVSSHVMEEARHCNDLLLLRDGALLAQGSPAQLRERTGVDDLEQVFLRLIDAGSQGASA
jgi:ABC-2 type transport system ATP-binding protein